MHIVLHGIWIVELTALLSFTKILLTPITTYLKTIERGKDHQRPFDASAAASACGRVDVGYGTSGENGTDNENIMPPL